MNFAPSFSVPNKKWLKWVTVAVLVFLNLIRQVPTFIIAGSMKKLKEEFGATNAMMGMIYTAYIVSFMVFSPLFGYLGDRYSRRTIMAVGVLIWSVATLAGSFVDPKTENRSLQWGSPSYLLFLFSRAFVGVGQASFQTIAPTVISDMFVKTERSRILALYFFALPVGSGFGFTLASYLGSWQWGLRLASIFGGIIVLCIFFLTIDPPRGDILDIGDKDEDRSYRQDLLVLIKNKSYVLLTLAFTCVRLSVVAFSWYGTLYLTYGYFSIDEENRIMKRIEDVKFVFGVLVMMSGVVGVPLGMVISTSLTTRYPRADPLICGVATLVSSAFLGFSLLVGDINIVACLSFIFFATLAVNMNWSVLADMVLYIFVPSRRATATAVQTFVASAFGDAGVTYLLGLISDALFKYFMKINNVCRDPRDVDVYSYFPFEDFQEDVLNLDKDCVQKVTLLFKSMQWTLFIPVVIQIIGAGFFFITAVYIVSDKVPDDEIEGKAQIKDLILIKRESDNESE